MRDAETNLTPVERILRVAIGILLFYAALRVSTTAGLYESGYYTEGTALYKIAAIVYRERNIARIIGWFLGFVLIFTGANGFSPTYKLLKRRGD